MPTLVNPDDTIIGHIEKLDAHLKPAPLHRAISVCVFNDNQELLIQKRSLKKPTWPGFWSNTCCTHPEGEESYHDAAERRIEEEMGFSCALDYLYTYTYYADFNETLAEHEIDVVFVGTYNGRVTPQKNEVMDHAWIPKKSLITDMQKTANKYTPWFYMIINQLRRRRLW